MKIIAKGKGDVFVVEATDDELARIGGLESAYRYKNDVCRDGFKVGDEFPVNEWWTLVRELKAKEQTIHSAAGLMRATADMIEKGFPYIITEAMRTVFAKKADTP